MKNQTYINPQILKLIPEVEESGHGDCSNFKYNFSISFRRCYFNCINEKRKFGKLDFKKFHPAGNLGKTKTASDVMLIKSKIPFVNENEIMKKALKILNAKKLGF